MLKVIAPLNLSMNYMVFPAHLFRLQVLTELDKSHIAELLSSFHCSLVLLCYYPSLSVNSNNRPFWFTEIDPIRHNS